MVRVWKSLESNTSYAGMPKGLSVLIVSPSVLLAASSAISSTVFPVGFSTVLFGGKFKGVYWGAEQGQLLSCGLTVQEHLGQTQPVV